MSYLLYAFLIILSPVIIPLFILLLPWSRRLTKLYLDNRIKASLQSSLETTTLQSGNIVLAANAKLFYWLNIARVVYLQSSDIDNLGLLFSYKFNNGESIADFMYAQYKSKDRLHTAIINIKFKFIIQYAK